VSFAGEGEGEGDGELGQTESFEEYPGGE